MSDNFAQLSEDLAQVLSFNHDVNLPEEERNPVVTKNADGTPRSKMLDLKWDFAGERQLGIGAESIVSFRTTLIDDSLLPGVQKAVFDYYKTNKGSSVSNLNYITDMRIKIAQCLNSTNWMLLEQDDMWREFKHNLKSLKLAYKTLEGVLAGVVSVANRVITDKKELSKALCCNTKKNKKQAIAIPEAMASSLFGIAAEIVEEHHAYRHAISDACKKYNTLFDEYSNADTKNPARSKKSYSTWYKRNHEHGIPIKGFMPTAKGLGQIQKACMLVLLGFSGVRISEANSFNKESYVTRDHGGIVVPFLLGEITKSEEGGKPRRESWVTHPIAEKALELAYDMSEFAREHYREKYAEHPDKDKIYRDLESAFLVLSIEHQSKKVVAGGWPKAFNIFMRADDIVATAKDVEEFNKANKSRFGELKEGGYLPKLSPHDFRRTFAMFLVRNKLGSILTLKHQYKHSNVVMTQWYTNFSGELAFSDLMADEELQQMVQEVNQEVAAHSLFEIHNSETLSGKEGKRIDSERKADGRYNGSVYVSLEECRRMVANGSSSIVEHPTGYCINPSCDRICADEKSMQTCQHEIVTHEKALEQLPFYYRLVSKFKALNNGQYYLASVLNDFQKRIESLEETFREHNIEFKPLGDMEINCKSIVE